MEIIPSIIKPVIENFRLKTLRGNYLVLACTGKMCTFPSPSPFEKVYFYISFLSPFDNAVNISLETIGHPQVVTLKYLRMRKLQFPNAIYNLLTKLSIERGSSGFFSTSWFVMMCKWWCHLSFYFLKGSHYSKFSLLI